MDLTSGSDPPFLKPLFRSLRTQTVALREDGRHALAQLIDNIAALEKSCSAETGPVAVQVPDVQALTAKPNHLHFV
jgi:hypothetical protein